ncbi:MAG: NAD-binding protein [Thermodesulfobacteriota bacterium]
MKLLFVQILFFLRNKKAKKNVGLLVRFLLFLTLIIFLYSAIFHLLMFFEGRHFSWITGFYWTLTVMSTLGFGDITFTSDLGMLFTLFVLLSGVIFLLIMLPFTFIQFFYAPWLEAQEHSRTPRFLPDTTCNHVILTHYDTLTRTLVEKLKKHNYDYVFVMDDQQKALELYDSGYKVVVGDIDHPETYRKIQTQQAALVVTTGDDLINTNVSFTVREVSDKVAIVSSADQENSLDILNFPGNTHVFQFLKILGIGLASRTIGVAEPNIIDRFKELLIAEFPVQDTILVDQSLVQARLRERLGLSVIAFLKRGIICPPDPHEKLSPTTILILAGTKEDMGQAGRQLTNSCAYSPLDPAVIILGGGRVGQASAEFLKQNDISYKIVEKEKQIGWEKESFTYGDAADIDVLKEAGIERARSVIVTTHDDAMNIYLSFYCRQLRPDIQIIARASEDPTISKLHRAGADQVSSAAARGVATIMSLLQPYEGSLFSADLNIFLVPIPPDLRGKTLTESRIREKTGCNVMALKDESDFQTSPDPTIPLPQRGELVIVGSMEAERQFKEEYME